MSSAVTQPPVGEHEFVDLVETRLRSLLPTGWQLGSSRVHAGPGDQGFDALLELDAPDGVSTRLVVEVKRSLIGRDVEKLSNRLRQATERQGPDAVPIVVSTFLSEPVRQRRTDPGPQVFIGDRPRAVVGEQVIPIAAGQSPNREVAPHTVGLAQVPVG